MRLHKASRFVCCCPRLKKNQIQRARLAVRANSKHCYLTTHRQHTALLSNLVPHPNEGWPWAATARGHSQHHPATPHILQGGEGN